MSISLNDRKFRAPRLLPSQVDRRLFFFSPALGLRLRAWWFERGGRFLSSRGGSGRASLQKYCVWWKAQIWRIALNFRLSYMRQMIRTPWSEGRYLIGEHIHDSQTSISKNTDTFCPVKYSSIGETPSIFPNSDECVWKSLVRYR